MFPDIFNLKVGSRTLFIFQKVCTRYCQSQHLPRTLSTRCFRREAMCFLNVCVFADDRHEKRHGSTDSDCGHFYGFGKFIAGSTQLLAEIAALCMIIVVMLMLLMLFVFLFVKCLQLVSNRLCSFLSNTVHRIQCTRYNKQNTIHQIQCRECNAQNTMHRIQYIE